MAPGMAVLVSCGSFNPPTIMHLRLFGESENIIDRGRMLFVPIQRPPPPPSWSLRSRTGQGPLEATRYRGPGWHHLPHQRQVQKAVPGRLGSQVGDGAVSPDRLRFRQMLCLGDCATAMVPNQVRAGRIPEADGDLGLFRLGSRGGSAAPLLAPEGRGAAGPSPSVAVLVRRRSPRVFRRPGTLEIRRCQSVFFSGQIVQLKGVKSSIFLCRSKPLSNSLGW